MIENIEIVESDANDIEDAKTKKLYQELKLNNMDFIPRGDNDVKKVVYKMVKARYPDLCNDRYKCPHGYKGKGMPNKPEWQHIVQAVMRDFRIESISRGTRRFK